LGIAVKWVIVPLVQLVTGPLFIPGGVVAGGLYMLFLVLAVSLTGKRGAATFCGLCQGIMVLVLGMGGNHGALSVLSYTLTGLAVDLVLLLLRHRGCCLLCCFFGGMAANLTGTLIVNLAFFQLPVVPLLLSLVVAALSGGGGGALACGLTKQLKKLGVVK
ncbi:MAG: ECF transporter S component, partial [Clostridiales bacterium]|nr:ECF transporter S component [Clostridiales bacterium]